VLRTAKNERTVSYVDGTNTPRTYKYRLMGETSSEILLYDGSRDIHARIDLKSHAGFARRGLQGPWIPLLSIRGQRVEAPGPG
jgi:hypothetical protein